MNGMHCKVRKPSPSLPGYICFAEYRITFKEPVWDRSIIGQGLPCLTKQDVK